MRNGVGEKFEKRSPGTSDTQKTKVLLTLKELGKINITMLTCKVRFAVDYGFLFFIPAPFYQLLVIL
jgi:hypothetical protein